MVGSGTAVARVAFPEQPPVLVPAHLLLVKSHNRKLAAVASFGAPVSGTMIWPIDLEAISSGRFGSLLRIHFPRIANGAGVLTKIDLRIPLRRPGGAPGESVLSARCDDGKLQAHILGTFVSGETEQSESVRTCTPTPDQLKST